MTVTTQMPDNTLEATGNYKCEKDTSLTLNDTTTNHPISMKTQNLQYQAFNTGNFTGFDDSSMYCLLTFTKCRKFMSWLLIFRDLWWQFLSWVLASDFELMLVHIQQLLLAVRSDFQGFFQPTKVGNNLAFL